MQDGDESGRVKLRITRYPGYMNGTITSMAPSLQWHHHLDVPSTVPVWWYPLRIYLARTVGRASRSGLSV